MSTDKCLSYTICTIFLCNAVIHLGVEQRPRHFKAVAGAHHDVIQALMLIEVEALINFYQTETC